MPLDQDHDLKRSMMSFGDHLEELRHRVIMSLVVPLPLMIVLFPFADDLREILSLPVFRALNALGQPAQLQAMSPAETLGTDLKLSIIFAIVLSCPWILWQGWKFIEPGLYNQERRFVHLLMPGSAVLTIAGLALLYFVMLPLMLRVLIAFGLPGEQPNFPVTTNERIEASEIGDQPRIPVLAEQPKELVPGMVWISPSNDTLRIAVPVKDDDTERVRILMVPLGSEGMVLQQYRLREYINFILMLMVGISIAFQMPLVILLLGWIGIVEPSTLKKNRKYALLVCAIVSAIITPADVISMVLMLVPLYALYEFGIILLRFAPADRVARGAIFKGAVSDVLGRFHSGEDDDDPEHPDEEGDGTPPPTDPAPPPGGTVPVDDDESGRTEE
jgi:Sec-independent protein secretion pathway component TatC